MRHSIPPIPRFLSIDVDIRRGSFLDEMKRGNEERKFFLGNVACEEILFSRRRRKRILKSWKKLLETISFDSFIYSDDILMVFLGFGWQKEGGKILKEKNSAEDSFLVTNTSSKNS